MPPFFLTQVGFQLPPLSRPSCHTIRQSFSQDLPLPRAHEAPPVATSQHKANAQPLGTSPCISKFWALVCSHLIFTNSSSGCGRLISPLCRWVALLCQSLPVHASLSPIPTVLTTYPHMPAQSAGLCFAAAQHSESQHRHDATFFGPAPEISYPTIAAGAYTQ
jgi:hypothetical protein